MANSADQSGALKPLDSAIGSGRAALEENGGRQIEDALGRQLHSMGWLWALRYKCVPMAVSASVFEADI